MKKLMYAILIIPMFMYSCGSESAKSAKCSDMKAYNTGVQAGKDNANMIADCNYFWQMDNDGEMSKSCYCKGYNSIKKSF